MIYGGTPEWVKMWTQTSSWNTSVPNSVSENLEVLKTMNSKSNQVTLIKYDDECRLQLEFALQHIKTRRFIMPVSTPAIIAKVFKLARSNPYSRYITLDDDLRKRMCGVNSAAKEQLKLELETALACQPYFDAASVALRVFKLVLHRPASYSAKRPAPTVDIAANESVKVPRLPLVVARAPGQVGPLMSPGSGFIVGNMVIPQLTVTSPGVATAAVKSEPEEEDKFLAALRAFTRPIKSESPEKVLRYNPKALPQPELAALMGNNGSEEEVGILKDDLVNAVVDGHSGLIEYLSEGLQEYLFLEKSLTTLPEYNRLTEEEKERLESHFFYFKKIRNLVVREMTPEIVQTVINAHADDTDSDEVSVGLFKNVKI